MPLDFEKLPHCPFIGFDSPTSGGGRRVWSQGSDCQRGKSWHTPRQPLLRAEYSVPLHN
jgi:hypothetical protein